ncbi:MAG: hypothetical protein J6C19_15790 [Lachnospiraceae bacterium]|nr:hypothetical protein [Lachnospiraceae bacterium]MBO5146962.1 hypothetical protein [Lachnospiraceae bacterium]
MGISGITGFSGLQNYRVSSIHGNPYSMNAIQRISRDNDRSGKPLVIASEETSKDLYVKDYGELAAPKSTATGDFAEMLNIQESMFAQEEEESSASQSAYASYLNDTIGMMGFQNRLRDQLNGAGFAPFA